MSRPKKQHFVPRFYLANFVDPEGKVWTYDKREGSARADRAENTAAETNFYSIKGLDGEYNDQLEEWLAKVESAAAPLYPKLLRGETLKGQERFDFSLFIATLYTRSPAMLNATARLYGDMIQAVGNVGFSDRGRLDETMDRMEAERGEKKTTKEERDKLFEFFNDKTRYTMSVDRRAGLMSISAAAPLTDILNDMSWIVVEPMGQLLITSDSPVVRITPTEYVHPSYGDGGFAHKKAFVTLPLAPTRMLEMYWGEQRSPGVQRAPKERGRLYNRQRAHFSERYLYSSRQDAGILRLGAKHKAAGLRIDVGHPGKRVPIEIKRKLDGRS
ncbi:DUF4238 domain-containing protein [Mesorhizobium sp. M0619]|uniref:DUF4238 domain-containing protein n=1 Tax=unclassified Mesorhizobium TaxID=325217 RepID=UPI003336ABA0